MEWRGLARVDRDDDSDSVVVVIDPVTEAMQRHPAGKHRDDRCPQTAAGRLRLVTDRE